MNIEIIKQEKDEVEFNIDNSTIAEIIRVYLNEQGVKFAAWRRNHPSKPLVMKIQVGSGTVRKAVADAVSAINKDASAFASLLKK